MWQFIGGLIVGLVVGVIGGIFIYSMLVVAKNED